VTRAERTEQQVRELLRASHPPVPPYLAERSAQLGRRRQRGRRLVWLAVWLLAVAVVVGLAVWAGLTDAWVESPSTTTPDFEGW
jgi:ferric-dicitrate binding protein FerR (iron transport regulator)